MNINRSYKSNNNTYANNNPQYIVVHNTDNFASGADALAHARAQYNGNFDGMSAHYYVDDGGTAYQAAPHDRGCWHVGKNYGGRLFGTVSNRNSIGVEMCVQAGYNYETAFQHTVEVVKQLMKETGIPADRVYQHYDVCAKNCPSQIRARGDWERFKALLAGGETSGGTGNEGTGGGSYKAGMYKVNAGELNIRSGPGTSYGITGVITDQGTYTVTEIQNNSWGKLKSGVGWINCSASYCSYAGDTTEKPSESADAELIRAGQIHCNNFCGAGLEADGSRGPATVKGGIKAVQQAMNLDYGAGLAVDGIWGPASDAALRGHTVRLGEVQHMVTALQILLLLKGYDPNGVESPGSCGDGCVAAMRRYQADHGLTVDGIAGYNTFMSLMEA